MTDTIWVEAKVLPGKEALDFFIKHWRGDLCSEPFNGESDIPNGDIQRQLTIQPDNISHLILDIDEAKYDPVRSTVPLKIKLVGPKSKEALEKYIKKELRFTSRVVTGTEKATGNTVTRIVTFDGIQKPSSQPVEKHIDNVKARREAEAYIKRMQGLKK